MPKQENIPIQTTLSELLEYIREKLKEQRSLCLKNADYSIERRYDIDENTILNAPEPILNDLSRRLHK